MNKPLTLALTAILCLALTSGCAVSHPSSESVSSPTPERPSLEYMLASIDAGYRVTENTIEVKRFRYLLKDLSELTGESQYDIADQTVKSTNHARESYGKEIKNLAMMERAHDFYKETRSKEKYNLVLAAIVIQEAK